jgi:hypothetical protein
LAEFVSTQSLAGADAGLLDFGDRAMCRRLSILLLTVLMAGAAPAHANEPGAFCRTGQIAVVRLSTLNSAAAGAVFQKAVADQKAWYRSHGFTANTIITTPVIAQDPRTKTWAPSEREVMSLHINPPPIDAVKPDAAWRSFVDGFKASSQLTADKTICLEKPLP